MFCSLAHALGTHTNTTADPPRPFDFVIDGELLRKSLEQHLLEHDSHAERAKMKDLLRQELFVP